MQIKTKEGIYKEIADLSQSELKEQIRFVSIKKAKKDEDKHKLLTDLFDNKEKIEQLMLENSKIEIKLFAIKEGKKKLNSLNYLLLRNISPYLLNKNPYEKNFERNWDIYVNNQADNGEECSVEEFKKLSTLIKKK